MTLSRKIKENWLQPFFFFGNNPTTLIGSGLTTASAVTLIFYWIASLMTGSFRNPYLGLIFFLGLPGLFILGLILIPVGMWSRRKALLRTGPLPETYPGTPSWRPDLSPWSHRCTCRNRGEPGHREHSDLSRSNLHGFSQFLWTILSRNGAAMGRLPGVASFPCSLRGLSRRLRYGSVRPGKG